MDSLGYARIIFAKNAEGEKGIHVYGINTFYEGFVVDPTEPGPYDFLREVLQELGVEGPLVTETKHFKHGYYELLVEVGYEIHPGGNIEEQVTAHWEPLNVRAQAITQEQAEWFRQKIHHN